MTVPLCSLSNVFSDQCPGVELIGQGIQNQENHRNDDLMNCVLQKDINQCPDSEQHDMNQLPGCFNAGYLFDHFAEYENQKENINKDQYVSCCYHHNYYLSEYAAASLPYISAKSPIIRQLRDFYAIIIIPWLFSLVNHICFGIMYKLLIFVFRKQKAAPGRRPQFHSADGQSGWQLCIIHYSRTAGQRPNAAGSTEGTLSRPVTFRRFRQLKNASEEIAVTFVKSKASRD